MAVISEVPGGVPKGTVRELHGGKHDALASRFWSQSSSSCMSGAYNVTSVLELGSKYRMRNSRLRGSGSRRGVLELKIQRQYGS